MRTTYWLINDEGNPNAQMIESAIGAFLWSFGFRHSFELRHSSFVIENNVSPPSLVGAPQ